MNTLGRKVYEVAGRSLDKMVAEAKARAQTRRNTVVRKPAVKDSADNDAGRMPRLSWVRQVLDRE